MENGRYAKSCQDNGCITDAKWKYFQISNFTVIGCYFSMEESGPEILTYWAFSTCCYDDRRQIKALFLTLTDHL